MGKKTVLTWRKEKTTLNALCFSFLLLFGLTFSGNAQDLNTFEIIKADSTFTIDSTEWKKYPKDLVFGGISGIERLLDGDLILVSDRQSPSLKPEFQDSWMFILDSTGLVKNTFKFYGTKNVEALRWDDETKTLWYSFENDESTGVGYIDSSGKPSTAVEHSMITSPFATLNRGIESLSIAEDLWYGFEAGLDSTVFIKWPGREKKEAEVYVYPLDKKSCLSANQQAGSSLGNGVSEILNIPGVRNKLLVLERCFNGKYAFIKLYEAKVSGRTFLKRELFDWNPTTLFQGKPMKPDNIEGMVWGEDIDGRKTVLLISDDNHNPKYQRTILLKLREK